MKQMTINYELVRQKILTVKDGEGKAFEGREITSSRDASEYARQFYHDDLTIYESFFILLLDRRNNAIAYAKISQGGISGTVVNKKIIAKYAVDTLASGVVLIHNHPSGNLQPSQADVKITNETKAALDILDVKVLDHVIIAEDDYYSFADNGLI